ncbi:MAG: hypothetical protein M3Z36_12440, partial [Acidobacteriota bacterium]|nr:hypothetical protein [Acidobacteriota bacterium]
AALIEECIPAARSAFGSERVEDSDIEKHAMEVSTAIFVREPQGTLIGFASNFREQIGGRDFVYLEGTALRAEWQGNRLYAPLIALRILIGARLSPSGSPLVTTRTQTPVVVKTMITKFGAYPRMREHTPDYLRDLAEAYAAVVREKHSDRQSAGGLQFDRDYLVVRRAYLRDLPDGGETGVCMYGDDENIPWCQGSPEDAEINAFIRERLDHQNGDAFLMIAEFDDRKTVAVLRKSAERAGADPAQVDRLLQSLP